MAAASGARGSAPVSASVPSEPAPSTGIPPAPPEAASLASTYWKDASALLPPAVATVMGVAPTSHGGSRERRPRTTVGHRDIGRRDRHAAERYRLWLWRRVRRPFGSLRVRARGDPPRTQAFRPNDYSPTIPVTRFERAPGSGRTPCVFPSGRCRQRFREAASPT